MSKSKWYLMTRHTDGISHQFFASEQRALAALAKALGYSTDEDGAPLRSDKRYIDNYGGVRIVEEAPRAITTARQMDALGRAYDARECGTATKAQLRLLDRAYF